MRGGGHHVTEEEAARSVLVQGLPIRDLDTTESSVVEAFSVYGDVPKLLLQTIQESQTQRAVVVFAESASDAAAALQANGCEILGAKCSVCLTSTMPALDDQSDADRTELEGRTLTTAEWIHIIFDEGPGSSMVTFDDDREEQVTEEEAARSVLVQGLPIRDVDTTLSSVVETFSVYGEVPKVLLQTIQKSQTQRAVVVFAESASAAAEALQANGREILGAKCSVCLTSTMPALDDQSDADRAELEGRTLTTAEWIHIIFDKGPMLTFDDDREEQVTEEEAARSVLVQGLPIRDLDTTESSVVETFSVYGEVPKLLLQTIQESQTQRAVVVFAESASAAAAALQANGREILGAKCSVCLTSTMPALDDQSDADRAELEGRTLTTAEWIHIIFEQGLQSTMAVFH
eukprot:g18639.t1